MQIDLTAYTRDAWQAHVNALTWDNFSATTKKPVGVTLHNTWRPLISEWIETDPQRAAGLNGMKAYYEGMGWHAGPHAFVSRHFINGFSPLTAWGIHSTCFNHTTLGIEIIGDYSSVNGESLDSGDGALVRDNAVFAVAVLMLKLGLLPDTLTFHKDCPADHHDCPGNYVVKTDMESRILTEMQRLGGPPPPTPPVPPEYTVHVGDTVDGIARRYGIRPTTIEHINNLSEPFTLHPGQVLKLVVTS